MQASIHTFDEQTRAGSVLLDDGREHPFSGAVFAASGLRHVRVGQRVSIEVGGATPAREGVPGEGEAQTETRGKGDAQGSPHAAVTRLWVVGVGDGQPIR